MSLFTNLQRWASHIKSETFALYLAARHPGTPWYAKILVAAIVAYALSPIDLIPDFIPVLGYLDDMILLPLGIALAIKFVPPSVLSDCRMRAKEVTVNGKPSVRFVGSAIVIAIWLLAAILIFFLFYK